jgi:hypothetical protein
MFIKTPLNLLRLKSKFKKIKSKSRRNFKVSHVFSDNPGLYKAYK